MKRINRFLCAAWIALACLCAAPAQADLKGLVDAAKRLAGPKLPYPVIVAGYKAVDMSIWGQAVHWVDNERVIFFGYKSEDHTKKGIWIWDVSRNSVTLHARVSDSARFCFARGYVRYMVSDPPPVMKDGRLSAPEVWRTGPLGREKEWQTPESEMTREGMDRARRERFFNPLTCQEYSPLSTEYKSKHAIDYEYLRLFDGHGALDVYSNFQLDARPARWFPAGEKAPVSLNLPRCAILASSIRYVAHLDSYFLFGLAPPPKCERQPRGKWPDVKRPILLLDANTGKTERLDISVKDWSQGSDELVLSRRGLLMTRRQNLPTDGLYLVTGGDPILVLQGRGGPTSTAVSPDGCKVAVNTPQFDSAGLQMVNLCNGGK